MSCNNYQNCINKKRDELRYPVDSKSLYAQRLYDNQTANKHCYKQHPINIEPFNTDNLFSMNNLLMYAVIAVVVFVLYKLMTKDSGPEMLFGGLTGLGENNIVEDLGFMGGVTSSFGEFDLY